LGFSGKMLGWSPFVKAKIRSGANKSLQQFLKSHPEYKSQSELSLSSIPAQIRDVLKA